VSYDHGAPDALADEIFEEVLKDGQSARRVASVPDAAACGKLSGVWVARPR
jgi:hypothetical protein